MHQVNLSASKIYSTPAWIALCLFAISTTVAWALCGFAQAAGYMPVSTGDRILLPIAFGLIFGASSFFSAVEVEIRFYMHMTVLRDRNCGWGEFRVFDRYRVRERNHLAFDPGHQ